MGIWNHRAIRDKTGFIGIHEVHYTQSGRIVGWTEKNVRVGEDSIGDLEITLNRMLACLELPVLEVYTYRGKEKLRKVKPPNQPEDGPSSSAPEKQASTQS